MRVAASKVARQSPEESTALVRQPSKGDTDAPLVDERGHIDLFPSSRSKSSNFESGSKTADEEARKREDVEKRRREYERDYTVKFSDAAGYNSRPDSKAWYETGEAKGGGRDVFGREDPKAVEREMKRVDANDPLAAMKRGARMVRVVKEERKRWEGERMKEVEGRSVGSGERRSGRRSRDGEHSERRNSRRHGERRERDRSRSRSRSRSPRWHRERRERSRSCERDRRNDRTSSKRRSKSPDRDRKRRHS